MATKTKTGAAKEPEAPEPAEPPAADPLEPFAELIGEVPDEKVAEMAGVPVEIVAAAADAKLRSMTGEPSAATSTIDPDDDTPPLPGEIADPVAYEQAKADGRIVELAAEPVSPPAAPAGPPAGSPVRCLRKAVIAGPDGRTWRISRRDVYSGARADWLRVHHPALVEPYPSAE